MLHYFLIAIGNYLAITKVTNYHQRPSMIFARLGNAQTSLAMLSPFRKNSTPSW